MIVSSTRIGGKHWPGGLAAGMTIQVSVVGIQIQSDTSGHLGTYLYTDLHCGKNCSLLEVCPDQLLVAAIFTHP